MTNTLQEHFSTSRGLPPNTTIDARLTPRTATTPLGVMGRVIVRHRDRDVVLFRCLTQSFLSAERHCREWLQDTPDYKTRVEVEYERQHGDGWKPPQKG